MTKTTSKQLSTPALTTAATGQSPVKPKEAAALEGKPKTQAPVDTAEFSGPVAPIGNAAETSDTARVLLGLSALKQVAQQRQADTQAAERQYGPAETWSAELLAAHPELAQLVPHIHLGAVREGDFERAAEIAAGHERLTPNRGDTVAAMWHSVRDTAVDLARKVIEFAKQHPGRAAAIGTGAVAIAAVALWAAPALAALVAEWLTPVMGAGAAKVVGVGVAGSLASGTRSAVVYSTPMLLGTEPVNKKQLAGDVSMSAGFGFTGFAQAQGLTMLTSAMGASGIGLMALNAIGLVGMEVFKDYIQNAGRNAMGTAGDPKSWTRSVDPKTGKVREGIWKETLLAETATNILRIIPGLETNFALKVGGDVAGTVWWDRIVNGRKKSGEPEAPAEAPIAGKPLAQGT